MVGGSLSDPRVPVARDRTYLTIYRCLTKPNFWAACIMSSRNRHARLCAVCIFQSRTKERAFTFRDVENSLVRFPKENEKKKKNIKVNVKELERRAWLHTHGITLNVIKKDANSQENIGNIYLIWSFLFQRITYIAAWYCPRAGHLLTSGRIKQID